MYAIVFYVMHGVISSLAVALYGVRNVSRGVVLKFLMGLSVCVVLAL